MGALQNTEELTPIWVTTPIEDVLGQEEEDEVIFTRLTVGLIFTRVSGSFGRTTRVSIGPPLLNVMDSWKLLKTKTPALGLHKKSCTVEDYLLYRLEE